MDFDQIKKLYDDCIPDSKKVGSSIVLLKQLDGAFSSLFVYNQLLEQIRDIKRREGNYSSFKKSEYDIKNLFAYIEFCLDDAPHKVKFQIDEKALANLEAYCLLECNRIKTNIQETLAKLNIENNKIE